MIIQSNLMHHFFRPIKLSSSVSFSSSSPAKVKASLNKQASLIENSNPLWMSALEFPIRKAASDQDIVYSSEDIDRIQMFVKEVSEDPTLLSKLVDYKQLIEGIQEQNDQILKEISAARVSSQNISRGIQQMRSQACQDKIKSSVGKQKQICSQIQNFAFQIDLLAKRTQKRQQGRKQNIKQLAIQIINKEQDSQKQIEMIKNTTKKYQRQKLEAQMKIVDLSKKIACLKDKFTTNDVKKQQLQNMIAQIRMQQAEIRRQKQRESTELEAYKNLVMKKKSSEIEIKKQSEKKLTKFIEELTKIIEHGTREQLAILAVKHDGRPQVRGKNSSSDTKPDENSEEDSQNHAQFNQLELMQSKIPALKSYRSMSIKPIQIKEHPKSEMEIQKQIEIAEKQEKLKAELTAKSNKLGEEQNDIDTFIAALRDKAGKINAQLTNLPKGSHFL